MISHHKKVITLTPDQGSVIETKEETKSGFEIKLADIRSALIEIGKHLEM